jgi:hypothetical protein
MWKWDGRVNMSSSGKARSGPRKDEPMELTEAEAPTHIKWGTMGKAGSGKTYTVTRVMSQFVQRFLPGAQLAMFDSEGGAGHVRNMVREITGKALLAPKVNGAFTELVDFYGEAHKRGCVIIIDSITHPWEHLLEDRLNLRRRKIELAHGDPGRARLTVADIGAVKEMWRVFSRHFVYDGCHIALLGREGIQWGTVTEDDGTEHEGQVGIKMKTETDTAHEPHLLVQMRAEQQDPTGRQSVKIVHKAVVWKDRGDDPTTNLTGKVGEDPDIEFFMPYIRRLNLGGVLTQPNENPRPAFEVGNGGPSWETIKAQREAVLEEIKNDLIVNVPGRTDEAQKSKILLLRQAFDGVSSWAALENDDHGWPIAILKEGRQKLLTLLEERRDAQSK